ncbi:MAG: hypothetical protein K5925_03935 [Bacilli bacterium]|nr:hypothetical protein [Bacilli bacterium]
MKNKLDIKKILPVTITCFSIALLLSSCNETKEKKKTYYLEDGFVLEGGCLPESPSRVAYRCKRYFKNDEPIIITVSFGHQYDEKYYEGKKLDDSLDSRTVFGLQCNNEKHILEEFGVEFLSNDYSCKIAKNGSISFSYTKDYIVNREWLNKDVGGFSFSFGTTTYNKESLEVIYQTGGGAGIGYIKNEESIELLTRKEYSDYLKNENIE